MKMVVVMCDGCQAELPSGGPEPWKTLTLVGCARETDGIPSTEDDLFISADYCSVRCLVGHLSGLLNTA